MVRLARSRPTGPLGTIITFDPRRPSYTLGKFGLGLKTDRWQMAAYVRNIYEKTAHLALDYKRGRSARVGYLTNQTRQWATRAAELLSAGKSVRSFHV
jgi:hypothetical protein